MKTKTIQLFILFTCCASFYNAQVSAYTFTQSSSSYGSANTGTLVGLPLQDDDVNVISLPFNFTYNGTSYNSLEVCSNGYISFNTLSGFEYTPISDNSTQDLISPFGQDLFMGVVITADMASGSNTLTNCSSVTGYSVGDVLEDYAFDFSGTNPTITAISGNNLVLNLNATNSNSPYYVINHHGYIKQNISGTSPNRIFELEYRNFTRLGVLDEMINFKVRLFETSNMIEFLYGQMVVGNDVLSSEVGLKGSSNSDFNSRKVNAPTTWNVSVASTQITDYCDFDQSIFPASGQSYKWSPLSCNTPSLSATQSKSTTCAGETSTITVNGATTYSWVNGPSTATYAVNPNTTTSYTIIGSNSSCTSSLAITQSVVSGPSLNIVQSTSLICVGESATLTANGANSYAWVSGSNAAQNIVSPTVSSTYTVIGYALPASYGTCSNTLTSLVTVSVCTGLSEKGLLNSPFSIYPNPFSAELKITNPSSAVITLAITDAVGKLIYTQQIKSESTTLINTEELARGFYFIKLTNGSESITKKLVKE